MLVLDHRALSLGAGVIWLLSQQSDSLLHHSESATMCRFKACRINGLHRTRIRHQTYVYANGDSAVFRCESADGKHAENQLGVSALGGFVPVETRHATQVLSVQLAPAVSTDRALDLSCTASRCERVGLRALRAPGTWRFVHVEAAHDAPCVNLTHSEPGTHQWRSSLSGHRQIQSSFTPERNVSRLTSQ